MGGVCIYSKMVKDDLIRIVELLIHLMVTFSTYKVIQSEYMLTWWMDILPLATMTDI